MMPPAKEFARFHKIRQIENTRRIRIATTKELHTLFMNSSEETYMRQIMQFNLFAISSRELTLLSLTSAEPLLAGASSGDPPQELKDIAKSEGHALELKESGTQAKSCTEAEQADILSKR